MVEESDSLPLHLICIYRFIVVFKQLVSAKIIHVHIIQVKH